MSQVLLFTLVRVLKNSLSATTVAAENTVLNATGSLPAVEARLTEQLRVIVTALTAWSGTSPFMSTLRNSARKHLKTDITLVEHRREMIEQL